MNQSPILLYYGASRTVIFRFQKGKVYEKKTLSFSRFDENKITWTCTGANPQYESAISRVPESNDSWAFNVNWSKVKMTSPEETFTMEVSYAGQKKIQVPIIVKFQIREISVEDLSFTLDRNTSEWGTVGNVCKLDIRLREGRQAWQYKDCSIKITFNLAKPNFIPANNDSEKIIYLAKGGDIYLKYNGYESAISKQFETNICFKVNNVDKFIPFTFVPQAYSYRAECRRIVETWQYGSSNTGLFNITLVRSNPLSPEATDIRLSDTTPKWLLQYFDIEPRNVNSHEWRVSLKNNCASFIKALQGIDCDLTFLIDGGKQTCSAKLCMGSELSSRSNYVRILRPKIKVTQMENPETVRKLFWGDTIPANTYVAWVKIGYEHIGQGKCLPIQLSDIHFNSPFTFSQKDEGRQIPFGEKAEEVGLIVSEDLELNDNIVVKTPADKSAVSKRIIKINWEYKHQVGEIEIPIMRTKLFPGAVDFENAEITFPRPSEPRVYKVLTLRFPSLEEMEKMGDVQDWDTNQTLSIRRPFTFAENEDVSSIPINPGREIPVYLNINKLGIDSEALNIEEPIELPIVIEMKGDKVEPIKITDKVSREDYVVKVNPIVEKAKAQFSFLYEGGKKQILKNKTVPVGIKLPDENTDAQAIQIGEILVENLSTIPSIIRIDEQENLMTVKAGVRRELRIYATMGNGHIDVLHKKTSETLPKRIELLNGTDENGYNNQEKIPIFIDYTKWKNGASTEDLELCIESKPFVYGKNGGVIFVEPNPSYYTIRVSITHLFLDHTYALDLGTTGIVLAKEENGFQECVTLRDVESNPIEADPEILSSHMMMLVPLASSERDNENAEAQGEIKLAPAAGEYYGRNTNDGSKRYRLAPSKFIIGQQKIPFLAEFYNNDKINKTLRVFDLYDDESKAKNIDFELSDDASVNKHQISDFIASLYKSIFDRCSTEIPQIRKLVITYPNTYSLDMLDEIKSIMKDRLGLTKEEQIVFVPESDAVAAYFFDQKIVRGGFLDESGNPKPEHNVIFYDMGAGTLDLSLVSFVTTPTGEITARIKNKLGVPLAGNYIDYIIYSTMLKDKWLKNDIEGRPNTIKDLTTTIKRDLEFNTTKIGLEKEWLAKYQSYFEDVKSIADKTYSDIFGKAFTEFLETCGNDVFKYLIPDGMKVDSIVFSGRGSQIAPLREKVTSSLSNWARKSSGVCCEELIDVEGRGDCLKTCVALGALKYQNYFSMTTTYNDAKERFRIENRNLYSKIAVVYFGQVENGGFGVKVEYLLDPQACDWSDAEFRNGTWCKDFLANITLENCLSNKWIYFVQTSLDEESLKSIYDVLFKTGKANAEDLRWAFVNQLFKKRIIGKESVPVRLKISKENKILERQIGDAILTDKTLLEDVEQSVLYRRSMWPFITSL